MANLTWGVTTSAGSVSQDSPTISDANMDRFVNYCWENYTQLDGNGDPLPRTTANEVSAVRDWMRQQWRAVKDEVVTWERKRAAVQARNAVGDLE